MSMTQYDYYTPFEELPEYLRVEHYENCEGDDYRKLLVRNNTIIHRFINFFRG